MNAIRQLKELSLAYSRTLHPTLPEAARSCRNYEDHTANGLTRAVIDFLRFKGHQAERIAVMGRYVDGTKTITDVTGMTFRIGSGKYIPGSMQRGSADISAIINGRSVKIEVKIGKDRQSEDQKRYQAQVERAGGLYWLCHTFSEFLNFYNELK